MDMLNMDDPFDANWLDENMLAIPDLSSQEAIKFGAMVSAAREVVDAKAKLQAMKREKEYLSSGPSQKISIRCRSSDLI